MIWKHGRRLRGPELVTTAELNEKLGQSKLLTTTLPDGVAFINEEQTWIEKLIRKQESRWARVGVLRESGHEHFNGSVVIPVFDSSGKVVGMYGRKITPNLREGTPNYLYLPGAHKGVWNEEALSVSKEIILCESLIDALSFWSAGFRNVTASYGVNGFTADHRRAFEKHGIERVYIAYDREEAADKAAAALAEELMGMGLECFRILFPKGMDANEYSLKVQPAAKSLGVLLSKAEWLGKGKKPEPRTVEPVIEPEPEPTIEPEPAVIEAAAKEELIEEGSILSQIEADIKDEIESQVEADADPIPHPVEDESEPAPAASPAAISNHVLPLAAEPEPVAPQELTAAPAPTIDMPVEMRGEDIFLMQGDRRYRIRGLNKNMSYELLKVNVLVSGHTPRGESAFHVDTLDLYSARQRGVFTKQAAEELGIKEEVVRRDLGRLLLKLEELQDEQIKQALAQKAWVQKYLNEARPQLVSEPDDMSLFLMSSGEPFSRDHMTSNVKARIDAAKLGKTGACHLFRHTMATLMHENGADIRFIQEILGHVKLETTQIYTHVSIRTLQQVHASTHPAAMLGHSEKPSTKAMSPDAEALFSALQSESEDDQETA